MAYIVRRTCTFLVPSGSSGDPDRLHLHVVSTEPCNEGKCLLLTISTVPVGIWYDPTRILEAGCHDFIKVQSFVNYQHAVVKRCETISKLVDGWTYHPKPDLDVDLTDYILSGTRISDMTPKYVIDYLDSIGI